MSRESETSTTENVSSLIIEPRLHPDQEPSYSYDLRLQNEEFYEDSLIVGRALSLADVLVAVAAFSGNAFDRLPEEIRDYLAHSIARRQA